MRAAHGFHHQKNVLIVDDGLKICRHSIAERVLRKGSQIENVLDIELFSVKTCGKLGGIGRKNFGNARTDHAEAEDSNMDHNLVHSFLYDRVL